MAGGEDGGIIVYIQERMTDDVLDLKRVSVEIVTPTSHAAQTIFNARTDAPESRPLPTWSVGPWKPGAVLTVSARFNGGTRTRSFLLHEQGSAEPVGWLAVRRARRALKA